MLAPTTAPRDPPIADASRPPTAAVALGLLAIWLLATLGLRPLLLPDEGRYTDVARAMWHGDWVVPTLDGLPFFHKPPLFYWIDIAAMHALGASEFAGRFGSAVGAWVMGATLFFAMRRWHGERVARVALGVLATTPFFFIGGQYANHDMLVGGLITAAVLALARAVDEPPRVDLRWLVSGWSLCALAMLAKGLIGIVLPAFVIGPWLLVQGRWRQMLKLLHPLGIGAFAIVGLPWMIAMQVRYPGFFDYFIVEQHFRRFAGSTFNNVHGVWFFFVLLPLSTLPWSAWAPAACKRAWLGRDRTTLLYAWWTLAIVGFFSIPSSKLVGYVYPALAPWCALLALPITAGTARLRRGVMVGAAVFCLVLVAVIAWKSPQSSRSIALALARSMAPNDEVAMVDEYLYDVPYYARLSRPVVILGDWRDPDIPNRDNWRKEIHDAARFDPVLAQRILRPFADIDTLACGASAVWFIAPPDQSARIAAQPGAARVTADGRNELWRVPGRPSCG